MENTANLGLFAAHKERRCMFFYVFLELDSVCTGPMLTAWLDPPVVPQLHIHLFNITNPQEVLVHLLPKYRMIA